MKLFGLNIKFDVGTINTFWPIIIFKGSIKKVFFFSLETHIHTMAYENRPVGAENLRVLRA